MINYLLFNTNCFQPIVNGVSESLMPWVHVHPRDGLWTEQSINSAVGDSFLRSNLFERLWFVPDSRSR